MSPKQFRSSMQFAIDVSYGDREVVLALQGELDIWTQSHFEAALAGVTEDSSCVVLDLSDLTYIDAASIGLIHRARNLARLRGADLVLRSPSPQLVKILEITGLSNGHVEQPIALPLPSSAYEPLSAGAPLPHGEGGAVRQLLG